MSQNVSKISQNVSKGISRKSLKMSQNCLKTPKNVSKCLKNVQAISHRFFIKKILSSQNKKYLFCRQTLKKSYGHKLPNLQVFFQKSHFWTFFLSIFKKSKTKSISKNSVFLYMCREYFPPLNFKSRPNPLHNVVSEPYFIFGVQMSLQTSSLLLIF
jgi:hypothetical protein